MRGRWEGSRWRGQPVPILIDHAAGFRKAACVTMSHENAFCTGAVRRVTESTYLNLRLLDAHAIAKFAGVLSERELRGLLQRRTGILAYFDKLVEEKGYEQVVIQDGEYAI